MCYELLVESPFRGETISRLVCLPLKERQQQALACHIDVWIWQCCPAQWLQTTSFPPFSLTPLVSSPASSIVTSSNFDNAWQEKRNWWAITTTSLAF